MSLNTAGVSRLIPFAVGAVLAATAACINDTSATAVGPGSSISVSPETPAVAIGDSVLLTVTLPATLQSGGATFASGNTAIAIARPTGWIIGVGRGKASITVTSVSDPRLSTSVSVLVTP